MEEFEPPSSRKKRKGSKMAGMSSVVLENARWTSHTYTLWFITYIYVMLFSNCFPCTLKRKVGVFKFIRFR